MSMKDYYIQCFPVYLVTYKNTCIATHLFAGYVVLPDNIWIKFRCKKEKILHTKIKKIYSKVLPDISHSQVFITTRLKNFKNAFPH